MIERDERWHLAEPGTVVEAGQPFRLEPDDPGKPIKEYRQGLSMQWTVWMEDVPTYVDSSWRPPLELPTAPTWGIALVKPYRDSHKTRWETGRCVDDGRYFRISGAAYSRDPEALLDFIPLTDEQVARIEAAQ